MMHLLSYKNRDHFFRGLISEFSIPKVLFCFSVIYFILASVILRTIFSGDASIWGNDSLLFHNIAIQLCHFVETGNFDFSLAQEGRQALIEYCNTENKRFILLNYVFQFPAVITAILYYIFHTQEPILINFTNILLHSLATTLLYLFFFRVSKDKISSLLAIVIVGFFPSNFLTLIAISKGVYYYLGFSIFCFSLTSRRKYLFLLLSILLLILARPYYFFSISYDDLKNFSIFNWQLNTSSFSDLIYNKLDSIAISIAKVRESAIVQTCTSNFDFATLPKSGDEIIKYIPKGFLIGLFKPFPNEWLNFNKGFFFFLASIEMCFIYIGLLLAPFNLFYRKSLNLLLVSIICLLVITMYGTISYNLGALYRSRFIFIGTLGGIGFMYVPILISKLRQLRAGKNNIKPAIIKAEER